MPGHYFGHAGGSIASGIARGISAGALLRAGQPDILFQLLLDRERRTEAARQRAADLELRRTERTEDIAREEGRYKTEQERRVLEDRRARFIQQYNLWRASPAGQAGRGLPPELIAEGRELGFLLPTRQVDVTAPLTLGGRGSPSEAVRSQAGRTVQIPTGERREEEDIPAAAPKQVFFFDRRTGRVKQVEFPAGADVQVYESPREEGPQTISVFNTHTGQMVAQYPAPPGQKSQIVHMTPPTRAGATKPAVLTPALRAAMERAAYARALAESGIKHRSDPVTGIIIFDVQPTEEQLAAVRRRAAIIFNEMYRTALATGEIPIPAAAQVEGAAYQLTPEDRNYWKRYRSPAEAQRDPLFAQAPPAVQAAILGLYATPKGAPPSAPPSAPPAPAAPQLRSGQQAEAAVIAAARAGRPFPEAAMRGLPRAYVEYLHRVYQRHLKKR